MADLSNPFNRQKPINEFSRLASFQKGTGYKRGGGGLLELEGGHYGINGGKSVDWRH